MKRKDRPYIVIAVVCLLVGVVANYFMSNTGAQYKAALAAKQAELSELENTLEVKRVDRTKDDNAVMSMVTGVDPARRTDDDKAFTEFISKICTWTGLDGYRAMVDEANQMPVVKNSQTFRKVFLARPSTEQGVAADVVPSCSFKSIEPTLVSVTGDKYTYFTKVNVVASSGAGAVETVFTCLYTMDAAHEISDLHGYVLD